MLAYVDINGFNQVVVRYVNNKISFVECTEKDQESAKIKARMIRNDINNRKNWKAISLV